MSDEINDITFCEECLYHGEPNGCNRNGGECKAYYAFLDLQAENAALRERLEKAVILPCKVGDTIYEATPVGIREWLVTSIELKDYGFKVNCEGKNDFKLHWHFVKTDCCNDFEGKGRIRVTREAAEKRLAELGGEDK